ncbi:MAG: ABC transporter ATP-binding protein [Burkholderiaceae bacterium]
MSLIDRFGEQLQRGQDGIPGTAASVSAPGSESSSVPAPAAPLVVVEDIAKIFDVSAPWLNRVLEGKPRSLLRAVDGVSFEIPQGQTLALVGESGCGKSTVARMLVGLYAPSRGRVLYKGTDIAQLGTAGGRAMRSQLQMIFQDPYASLNPRWKVLDIIAEPIRVHRLIQGQAAITERVEALLGQVGLAAADAQKYPHQFSGGQRQRLSIARALASQPQFLVCDEPTSALDVSVQAQVLNLMREIQQRESLTYLFISHNLAVVHHVSDHVGVMYLGRIVELAPKRTLFAMPRHPYTRMLLDAIPDMQMTGKSRTPVAGEVPNPLNPPTGCTFHPRCPHANDRCRSERPVLMRLADGAQVACHAIEEGRA